jgi:hypothetical protein
MKSSATAGPPRVIEFNQVNKIRTQPMWKTIVKPRPAWFALLLGMSLLLPVYAASKGDKEVKDDKSDKKAVPAVALSDEDKQSRLELIAKAKFKDIDTCVSCHDAENEFPVFPIFQDQTCGQGRSTQPDGKQGMRELPWRRNRSHQGKEERQA